MMIMNLRVALVYIFVITFCRGDSCTRIQIPSPTAATEGKQLSGYTYFETSEYPNILSCGKRCLKQRKCKSVNFNDKLNICQLNSESHVSKQSALISSPDFQYYNVNDWPQEIMGPCAYHGCPEEQVCEPGSGTSRYKCTQCVAVDGCVNCLPPISTIEVSGVVKLYKPIGCFKAHSDPNPLPTLLLNFRSQIDWYNLQATIDKCVTASSLSGYKYFGIEFYGECWVGNQFDVNNHTKVSAPSCASTYCDRGYAAASYMFIYQHI